MRLRLLTIFAVLALAAAACGAGDETGELPLAPDTDPGDVPSAVGACLEGEPECDDTVAIGDDPQDLTPPSDFTGEPTLDPMLVDGGLSVSEALATEATGVLAVKGLLFVDERGARLCELLAESYPPLCGGAELPVTNYEEVLGLPIQSAQGISWTDQAVSFLGEIVDGTLVVDPMIAQ